MMEDETHMKLELSISCDNLPNMDTISLTDSACVVFLWQNESWIRVGQTETITDNLNPKFVKTILVDYFFEQKQKIMIKVYDVDDFDPKVDVAQNEIGLVEFYLHEILKGKNQTIVLPIKKGSAYYIETLDILEICKLWQKKKKEEAKTHIRCNMQL